MLSIIVAYVNEWPQVAFTLRSIAEDLLGRADFEIIAVDNYGEEVANQGFEADRGSEMVRSMAEQHDWLKYISYSDKLSHWNAKRVGIEAAQGDVYAFIDAHCIVGRDALYGAYRYYRNCWEALDGTLHLPLTYHILEGRRLKYCLQYSPEKYEVHYQFATYADRGLVEVPCMSTCGMLIHKDLYELTGGWPELLGTYGGGEHFINFVLSILGKHKYIYPAASALYHHGEKRGYKSTMFDYVKNRAIATFLFGGHKWLDGYLRKSGIGGRGYTALLSQIINCCQKQREHIEQHQQMSIEEWVDVWSNVVDK